jgi:rhodanese-related sulfurtransferase
MLGALGLYGESLLEASDAHARVRESGYRNVGVLEDGFTGWVRRGCPVEPPR